MGKSDRGYDSGRETNHDVQIAHPHTSKFMF
jgi:hypothetical protein